MNFIYNIYNYFTDKFYSYYDQGSKKEPEIIKKTEELYPLREYDFTIINHETHNFFINTTNIYNATELLMNKLYNEFYNKPIKIYLLKNDTLKPLFYNNILATDKNIKKIHKKLKKQRRHLHTFVDAIDSFIEYNNIHNYSIFY